MTSDAVSRWRPRSWAPALGVIGLPLLWLANQQINYLIVGWVCRSGHIWVFHLVSALVTLLAAVVVLITARHWRQTRTPDQDLLDTRSHRQHLFATVAFALSALFTLAIILQWIPTLMLGPCHR